MRSRNTLAALGAGTLVAACGLTLLGPANPAFAHGFVEGDTLTTRAAMAANADRGPIQYEPQSLEAPKGFPEAGPKDGQLASAGQPIALNLDEQSEDRWVKNDVSTGPVEVAWNFTAAHMTTEWRYYMTLPGWDPNDPLDRGDFELIGTVEHDGSAASNNPVHTVDIPEDRSGYHVIYAVWDVADTANAFYNVIDVNVDGASRDEEAPTAAGGVTATATSGSTADVSWTAATDNVGVTGYDVYLNDVAKPAASVKGNVTKAALEGLKPETTYDVRVVAKDAAGNRSASTTASLVTPEASEDTHAPSAPSHLHAMSVTAQSVDLMWGASKDNVAVVGYDVLDAKTKDVLGHAAGTRLLVEGLTADTEYAFEVVARDAAGNTSAASNVLTVTTAAADSSLPQWDAFESYVKGDRVSFEGKTYEAVQGYQGHGDPNWITALSLWRLV